MTRQIICEEKALANLRAGRRLFESGALTYGEADRWNEALDRFLAETDALLAPHVQPDPRDEPEPYGALPHGAGV